MRRAIALTLVAIATCISCTAAKTAAQRIDDAALAIANTVKAGADDVEDTFRLTLRAGSDEALAESMEKLAAAKQSTWTTKAWNAAKATTEVAQNEVVGFVASLTCEGLERWDKGETVYTADVTLWASQLMGLPQESPAVVLASSQAISALAVHSQRDMEYVRWVRATACFVDAIP